MESLPFMVDSSCLKIYALQCLQCYHIWVHNIVFVNVFFFQSMKSPDGKVLRQGRTLEEARALIEQSFGNYVGNDVKIKATKEISKLEARIAQLQGEEIPDVRSLLTNEEVDEYMSLKQNLKVSLSCLNGVCD